MDKPTKEFPTEKVISAIAGTLICEMGGVYEVLNWMSGDSLFTHQLPRVSREARAAMLAHVPSFSRIVDEAEQVNSDNWKEWRDRWVDRYGPTMAVPKMNSDQHERIDPISELAEKVHPSKIVVA